MKAIRYKDGTLLMPGSQAHKLATDGKSKELDAHMKEVDAKYRAANGDPNWRPVSEHGFVRWLHREKPLWVVHYAAGSKPFWQAYRADPLSHDVRERPWCAANRRIGQEGVGFQTFEAATAAALKVCQ